MMNNTANRIKWVRVNKKQPCPVCGKPDWCTISPDGKKALCHRFQSQQITKSGNGWIHDLETSVKPVIPIQPAMKTAFKAEPRILNTVYSRLLAALTLSPQHRENLLKRGLTEQQIESLGYKSMPQGDRNHVITKLVHDHLPLQGVPGFWRNSLNHWHLSELQLHGIAIPIRNLNGWITGIQIRQNEAIKNKYVWLSSVKRPHGCSPGVCVHVAMPEGHAKNEVWVTEGPLKADIASLKLNSIVLAVPGVGCWKEVIPVLHTLGIHRVIVAFDMDKTVNPYVEVFEAQLINNLITDHFKVYKANWNAKHKGIDDILNDWGEK